MMRMYFQMISATAFSCIAAAVSLLLSPATLASSVTVSVGAVQSAAGSKVKIPIAVKDARKLGAIQLDLRYDPELLEFVSAKPGSFDEEIKVIANAAVPGELYVGMHTSARDTISGSGALIDAVFKVIGADGQGCDLLLENVEAWYAPNVNTPALEMLVTTETGRFTVAGTAFPGWIWIAGAALAGLLLFLLVKKKSTRRKKTAPPKPGSALGSTNASLCTECGTLIPDSAKFCPNCGTPASG